MKHRKKAGLTFVMVLLAAVMFLSACGKSGGNGSGGSTTNNVSTNEPAVENAGSNNSDNSNQGVIDPAKLKPYKIKLVYEGGAQKDEAKVEEALNKILTEKINATIDIVAIDWGEWDDKMNLMIASREPVDILFTAQWNGYANNAAKGAYLDLGPLLKKYGQGIKETLDPLFLEGSKINGVNYAIPTNKELATEAGIVYRKDVAEELGIDMTKVKTIDDLDAVYKIVKEKRPDMYPAFNPKGPFTQEPMLEVDSLGTGLPGVVKKTGTEYKIQFLPEMPEYIHGLKVARDFYLKGYFPKDMATSKVEQSDLVKNGKVFSTFESLKPGKAEENAAIYGLEGKLAQLSLTSKTVSTTETAGAMLAISSTSEDPERAMMFINLLHTDKEIVNLLNFGIEGVHFTLNGDVMTPTGETPNYAPGVAWELGNQFLNYLWNTENPDKWRLFKEFNTGATASPSLGFVFDTNPVKAEVGAVSNVVKQYDVVLATGSVDPDKYLPEYVEALKKAGVQKILDEMQKQFDEFAANK